MRKGFRVGWLALAGLLSCLLWVRPFPAQGQDADSQQSSDGRVQPSDAQAPQEQAGQGTEEPSAPNFQSGEAGNPGPDYILGPEDVLTIEVFNLPEMKEKVRVENDGTIPVKLLGHVKAAGLTTEQLREQLEESWGKKYLQDPEVTVFINLFHARPVSLVGAVEKAGLYRLPGSRNLIEVIAMAGGLAKGNQSPGRWVYITRKEGFGDLSPADGMELISPNRLRIELKKLLYSPDSALNLPIKPYDSITIPKAGIVYVVGAVKTPGGFILADRESVTVLQAVAMAAGALPSARSGKAQVIHIARDGTRTETPVNLARIIKGKGQDVTLAANDILVVPDSTGKYLGQRGVEAAFASLTGLLIFGGL